MTREQLQREWPDLHRLLIGADESTWRQLAMLALQSICHWSVASIAEAFGVSERNVERSTETMKDKVWKTCMDRE